MKTITFRVFVLLVALTSCSSIIKYPMTEKGTHTTGGVMATTNICYKKGHIPWSEHDLLLTSADRMLSVSKYNTTQLEAGAKDATSMLAKMNEDELTQVCTGMRKSIRSAVKEFNEIYDGVQGVRKNGIPKLY